MFAFRARSSIVLWSLLLSGLLVFTACDDDTLTPPPVEDELFDRYVSLGNSITAGFQSNGITPATQQTAYPVLVAEQMGTDFEIPLLNAPGCPPPIANPLTGERESDVPCAARETPPPPRINNTAVPGAAVTDLLNIGAGTNANVLTQFILGGRTQVEAAVDLNPTFASIWIGNNDVLVAALSGQASEQNITPLSSFTSDYTEALDALEDAGTQGGILFGVADPTLIPHFSVGAAYAAAEDQINALGANFSPVWGSFSVDASCAPGAQGVTTLVPANYGLIELLGAALEGADVTLNCADDARVLRADEINLLQERVDAYNAFIEDEANARGWAYASTNEVLRALRDEGDIPPFPNFENLDNFFGPAFSLDGVHPTDSTHELIANEAIEAINAEYGTGLQPVSE